jgi:hypothetical protein
LPPLNQPTTEEQSDSTGNSTSAVPAEINETFKRLARLEGVPFNYLVPNEQMLPPESIRFFQVDWLWVESLLDGAFSIGRVTPSDHQRDEIHEERPAANHYGPISGFLIRSAVVAGWPALMVDGYDEVIENIDFVPDSKKLNLLRMERLSESVLLCLFEGEVQTVDIHQKPEALHFGLGKRGDTDPPFYIKALRDREGRPDGSTVEIPWRDGANSIVNVAELVTEIQEEEGFTSAQFALEMIEWVDKVRFVKQES